MKKFKKRLDKLHGMWYNNNGKRGYPKFQIHNWEVIKMLKRKAITEMNINDEFVVEYGCYGNYTKAIIKDIRPTDYDHIKEVDYTIPNYTDEKIYTERIINVEVKG